MPSRFAQIERRIKLLLRFPHRSNIVVGSWQRRCAAGHALSVSQMVHSEVKPDSTELSDKASLKWLGNLALPVVIVAFAALIPLWFSFEHRLPTIDESGHILNAFSYADLFKHARVLRPDWWHQVFSVNSFYPPFAHMTNGFFKAFLGGSRAVDIAVLTLWNGVLTASVYGIAAKLTKSKRAALISAITINLIPAIALINRSFWLDLPLTAMVAVGLFSLFNFRANPNWKQAACVGIAFGCACMTKQIAFAYLVLPAVFVFCEPLVGRTKYLADSVKLVVAGLIAAAIGAPWFLLNYEKAKLMADDCAVHIAEAQTFSGNLSHYLDILPSVMSPLLVALLTTAIFFSWRLVSRQLLPLILSAVGGVVAVSTLAWITPKAQYIAPAMISASVVVGCFIAQLTESRQRVVAFFGWCVMLFATLQILSLEFAPYPVSSPALIAEYAKALGNDIAEPRLGINLINPHPQSDWGQYWALKTVNESDKGASVWLNILSNSPNLNVHTFELLSRDMGLSVKPTTSRVYTIGGDTATFSPKQALYYQWYLIQSQNRYQGFANKASEKAFNDLKTFVNTDSRFRLVGTRALPDGTTLSLYRQK